MAEAVTVARPYAEAVFKMAAAKYDLANWSKMLQSAAEIAQNDQIKKLIGNPAVSAEQLGSLLNDIGKTEFSQECRNFLMILAENDRVSVLPEISRLFEQLKARHEGTLEANIVSAFEMGDEQLSKLVADLERKFKRKIEAKIQVDTELIGGVKVEVGDEIFDASIRGKLEAMANALKS